MSTVYGYDEDGNMFIEFDSRWRFPHLLGFTPEDPEYAALQTRWEEYTGQEIPAHEKLGSDDFSSQPVPTWDKVPEHIRRKLEPDNTTKGHNHDSR